MTKEEIVETITSMASHVTFDYNGRVCGIDPLSRDYIEMWYGEQDCVAQSIDEVFIIPLFDEKNFSEIIDDISDDVDTESEMLAWEFAVTGTEQHVEYVCRWNAYKVFQHFVDNPWGNHGKGISIATNFILIKNGKVRFATPEEVEELCEEGM